MECCRRLDKLNISGHLLKILYFSQYCPSDWCVVLMLIMLISLQWHHNGCLLNRLFRGRSKKTSKLRVTGLCAGNSPVTGEFPAQRASNAENVSVWWRHHVLDIRYLAQPWTATNRETALQSKTQRRQASSVEAFISLVKMMSSQNFLIEKRLLYIVNSMAANALVAKSAAWYISSSSNPRPLHFISFWLSRWTQVHSVVYEVAAPPVPYNKRVWFRRRKQNRV